MIKTMCHYLALLFYSVGDVFAPKYEIAKKEQPRPIEPEEAPVAFKELKSYLNEIATTPNTVYHRSDVCNSLKEISLSTKGSVKLTYTSFTTYQDGERIEATVISHISAWRNNRWYKLKELPLKTATIPGLIDELVEALGQEGWGCMEHSVDQLFSFMSESITDHEPYLLKRSKATGINCRLRMQTTMVLDVTNSAKRSSPPPRISTDIAVWTDINGSPASTNFNIYFTQQMSKVNSQPL